MKPSVAVRIPPLLLFHHTRPSTGLEQLLSRDLPQPGVASPVIDTSMNDVLNQYQDNDYNQYILSQILMYYYIKIFMTMQTTQLYRNLLEDVANTIRSEWLARKITDRGLSGFVSRYFDDHAMPSYGQSFINELTVVQRRLDANVIYPGHKDLLAVISLIYDDRPIHLKELTLYRIQAIQLEDYDTPTLCLTSLGDPMMTMSSASVYDMTDPLWKFIHSLSIPAYIKSPGDLDRNFLWLAQLALPLDPINLTIDMRFNMSRNEKAGVPFINYLAMYYRQKMFGFNYTLSRLANSRRILLNKAHKFLGVGGTCIIDSDHVHTLLRDINTVISDTQNTMLNEDEYSMLDTIQDVISSVKVPFVRTLIYEDSLEAINADKPAAKTKDDGAFDSDDDQPDPSAPDDDDPQPDSSDTSESGDNTIANNTGGNQAVASRASSTFLPLALPTETIDDHLYRLSVLRYVSDLDTTQDPDIEPEDLQVLKIWSEMFLFIASAAATRTLISQLKLTGKLKEFLA